MKQQGFTLIELVVTLVVLAVLIGIAAPSFALMRERQALRGAADNFIIAVGLAKEEATKRNALVRVDFREVGDGACVGAVVVEALDDEGCDCSSEACDVSAFPEVAGDTEDLRGVQLSGDIAFGTDGSGFVIDPRTGTLANIADTGSLTLTTRRGYTVELRVNALARATVCTPDGAERVLPGASACN